MLSAIRVRPMYPVTGRGVQNRFVEFAQKRHVLFLILWAALETLCDSTCARSTVNLSLLDPFIQRQGLNRRAVRCWP